MSIATLQAPLHARVENCSLGSLQAELFSTSQLLCAKLVSFSRILLQLGSKFPVTPVFILPF